ncbi:MAG: alpha/beta hydrolase [Candidatus Puniceispirillales bacterium]
MEKKPLIAADTAAFIRTSETFAALETAALDIEGQRRQFEALCDHFRYDHPPGLTVEDTVINGVRVRQYTPPDAATARLLYFHGGGFVVGSLETHDSICADLAAATGMQLVAVDYRLAPEHLHPAALDDGLAVRDGLLAESDRPIITVGDSAGGWLAAMVTADDPALVCGQVLIYPMLGAPMDAESYRRHANAPLLSAEAIGFYWASYRGTAPAPGEPVEPLALADLSAQPETRIIAAGLDPLADDGPLYAARLEAAGVPVSCFVAPGLPHGFLRARHLAAEAGDAWQRIIAACRALG